MGPLPVQIQTLQRMRDTGFVACFYQLQMGSTTGQSEETSIEYLRHVVSKEGLAVDPSKVAAIQAWPTPTNVKELRGFLDLAGYYRWFIKTFATLAAPLTDFLQKGEKFEWITKAQEALELLKTKLCLTPMLALPDFSKEFVVETDASRVGIGAVLTQENRPWLITVRN
ncbi:uncharacterized mitochondrial protein AtMg00860-like [Gossypium arboreum]|uniref:uncharacterized mitochondrial protein AtMg00860-like n=1 Tax=Gossypium arboreum TaxID=29729 RepID=UPI000818F57E|nr:uncharacterized mitochondrial protein AtMg00860-like [Gossypium arboreum]